MVQSEVLVCHAGTCLAAGGEAVLTEIEELADAVGGLRTRPIGCIGYCNQAPNVLVRDRTGAESVWTRINSLERSAEVVTKACGAAPDLGDPLVAARLEGLRAARAREHAKKVFKWNAALRGLREEAATDPEKSHELGQLLAAAGFGDGTTLSETPAAISQYTRWTLESVAPVSRHSAVFKLTSKDRMRGTPHPRGRGRMIEPVTWHTTLLAEVGPNDEGPLPWIERDYTPVSTAHDWEQGRVEILIKIYEDGAATSWLHTVAVGAQLWLSRPVATLRIPWLVADGGAFRPASVLLVLAGTGVVALPQILAHREPQRMLRISTPRRDQLKVPIDAVLSFRGDDALLVPEVAAWCREGGPATGLRNCELLLTPEQSGPAPFPDGRAPDAAAALAEVGNATVSLKRLDLPLLAKAHARMPRPCRVVVSGPDAFNRAVRDMFSHLVDKDDCLTILSA